MKSYQLFGFYKGFCEEIEKTQSSMRRKKLGQVKLLFFLQVF